MDAAYFLLILSITLPEMLPSTVSPGPQKYQVEIGQSLPPEKTAGVVQSLTFTSYPSKMVPSFTGLVFAGCLVVAGAGSCSGCGGISG